MTRGSSWSRLNMTKTSLFNVTGNPHNYYFPSSPQKSQSCHNHCVGNKYADVQKVK